MRSARLGRQAGDTRPRHLDRLPELAKRVTAADGERLAVRSPFDHR